MNQKIEIPNSVTSIRDWAFAGCERLTSVEIPNSVTSIGNNVFTDCHSLETFNGKFASEDSRCLIVDGVLKAFAPASGLTSYSIPNSVTEIGDEAFYGCSSLTSVVIPNSVTSIRKKAFAHCWDLTSVSIPNSVTSIEDWAFAGCESLTLVKIPNSVTSIGNNVFTDCYSLETFNGKFASEDNRCLIVDGVLKAFAPAGGLTSYSIPNSVTEIGKSVFNNCSILTSFTGKFASEDHRCLIIDGVLKAFAPADLISYEIPNSVTSIGDRAFEHCTHLTSVTIPNSVTSIGDRAFSKCTSLKSIKIPNSVTKIEEYAFYDCSNLTSVVIGNSVTEIRKYAFCDCTKLKEITSLSTTPPSISLEYDTFDGIDKTSCILKVPAKSVNAYSFAEGWAKFWNIEIISDNVAEGN